MEQEKLIDEIVEEVLQALASNSEAQPSGYHLQSKGLVDEVHVAYDAQGAAHIKAKTEADAYFAQGFVTARDRLWQMDLLRRIASGRASEIMGDMMLASDKHYLQYGFSDIAAKAVGTLDPLLRGSIIAYVAGVNACIEEFAANQWPAEFGLLGYTPEPWTAEDCILISRLQSEALTNNWLNQLLAEQFVGLPGETWSELFEPPSPLEEIVFVTPPEPKAPVKKRLVRKIAEQPTQRERSAITEVVERKKTRASALRMVSLYGRNSMISNNWVVSGKHTASGAPILANDPHLQSGVPGIWHLIDLSFGDTAFAGSTMPGLPGILIGHNQNLAWGVTNLGAQVQVLYQEDIAEDGTYATPDGPQPCKVVEHQIAVRKGKDEIEHVSFPVKYTRNGPVVFEADGDSYALSWGALDPKSCALNGFYKLARAQNVSEAQQALLSYDGPAQNFVFASTDGDIAAQIGGYVPERPSTVSGLPLNGPTTTDPLPRLNPAKLPRVVNPDSGIIATANNRTMDKNYPYFISNHFSTPYRARRIVDRLKASVPADIASSVDIQGDTFSLADVQFVDFVMRLARPNAVNDTRWQAMVSILGAWNGSTTTESVAITLSARMRGAFTRHLLSRHLTAEQIETYMRWDVSQLFIDQILRTCPSHWLPEAFASYEALLLQSFDDAVSELAGRFGPDVWSWEWRKVAPPIVFAHPLAGYLKDTQPPLQYVMPNGTGGFGATVNAGNYVSMRFVADLSDWNITRMGLPVGQSGDWRSPHFNDQLASWYAVNPDEFSFGESAFGSARDVFWITPVKVNSEAKPGKGSAKKAASGGRKTSTAAKRKPTSRAKGAKTARRTSGKKKGTQA